MGKTIVITGAAGSIGRKLRAHLAAKVYELRLLDVTNDGDTAVQAADLAVWDEAWVGRFKDADCVVHLAGDPRPDAPWDSIERLNIDLVLNVYEAAVRQGAKRLIFASSNWTMAGHRFEDDPLTPDTIPYPVNAYGVSKWLGERLGRSYSERWGLSVICFRIGYCQHLEGNPPGPQMGYGSWGQLMWLSDDDICQAHELAIEAPPELRFAVLNLMSENEGMRWDLGPTRDALGYAPTGRSRPVVDEAKAAQEESARQGHRLVEATQGFFLKQKW